MSEIKKEDLTPFELFTFEKLMSIDSRVTNIEATFRVGKYVLVGVAGMLGLDVTGLI